MSGARFMHPAGAACARCGDLAGLSAIPPQPAPRVVPFNFDRTGTARASTRPHECRYGPCTARRPEVIVHAPTCRHRAGLRSLIGPRFTLAATTVQSLGDATIAHDPQAGTWTVGAGGAVLTVSLDPSSDWQVKSLVSPTGRNWISGAVPDAWVTVNGTTYAFGSRSTGFVYTLRVNLERRPPSGARRRVHAAEGEPAGHTPRRGGVRIADIRSVDHLQGSGSCCLRLQHQRHSGRRRSRHDSLADGARGRPGRHDARLGVRATAADPQRRRRLDARRPQSIV